MTAAEDCGRRALACIDKALAARPEKDGQALTEATGALCAFREDLIGRTRGGGSQERRRLEHCNAVLSIVAAVHFPLGDVPWEELQLARKWLAGLLGESASSPSV